MLKRYGDRSAVHFRSVVRLCHRLLRIACEIHQLPRMRRDPNLLVREGPPMTEPKIIGHLDAATRIYQAAADEQFVREASSVDGYRDYLMRAFGFEKGSRTCARSCRSFRR